MRAPDHTSRLSPVAVNPASSRKPWYSPLSKLAGGRLRGEVLGQPLSPRELAMLRQFALTGDRRTAAHKLGVTYNTGITFLTLVYAKLGVTNALEAFRVLGWLTVPRITAPLLPGRVA